MGLGFEARGLGLWVWGFRALGLGLRGGSRGPGFLLLPPAYRALFQKEGLRVA